MIAAHSVFFSMSVTDAFWVFRILPRIGSRAWCSEDRAFFAVPSALSPSTMNSSERSTSCVRQSARFVGMVVDFSAFLLRVTFLCMRAAMRAHLGDHLVDDQVGLLLLPLLRGGEELRQPLLDDPRHDRADRRGAEHLLGLALELRLVDAHADHGGQARERVVLLDLLVL